MFFTLLNCSSLGHCLVIEDSLVVSAWLAGITRTPETLYSAASLLLQKMASFRNPVSDLESCILAVCGSPDSFSYIFLE